MPAHLKKSHHNTGLLFQFVLTEFIASFSELKNLIVIAAKSPNSEEIGKSLRRLVGASGESCRLIYWGHDDGMLTKFRQACDLFIAEFEAEQADLLHLAAEEAWGCCLECSYLLEDGKMDDFFDSLSELVDLMESCGFLLVEFCEHFADNENVLYFLLRNQKELDALFEEGFVRTIFLKLFDENMSACSEFMAEKFKQRGFHEQLPVIAKRIAELS